MATLATLLVVMGMDTKALTAGAAKAETSLAGVGTSASKFGAVAAGAAVLAGAAIIKFGADSVQAFTQAEQVMAQTEAVLKSTGGTANVTADDVLHLASTWEDLTGIQDDAIQTSENLLLTFRAITNEVGKGNDIFNQTEIAVLDMATAMNHGAIPSVDQLHSSTLQLGKALNDPITGLTALRRAGVSFTAEQTKMITRLAESGHLLEAQKLVLAEVTKEFGGAAVAAGETFGGQVAKLNADINNLQESIGKGLLPVMKGFLEGVDAIINDLGILAGPMGLLIDVAGRWGTQLDEATASMKPLAEEAIKLGQELFQQVAPAVERFGAGIIHLGEEAEKAGKRLRTGLSKAAKGIRDDLVAEIPGIVGTVTTMKETFTISPAELVKITSSWARIARTIARDLREIGNSDLKPAMREAIAALPPEMRHAWVEGNAKQRGQIETSIKTTLDTQKLVPGLARKALQGGSTVGKALSQGIANGIDALAPGITAAAESAVNRAIAAARSAAQAASPSRKMFQLGLDLMTGLQKGITDNEQKVIDAAQKVIDQAISQMESDLSRIEKALDKVKAKSDAFASSISGGFGSFLDISGGLAIAPPPKELTPDELAAQAAAVPTTESVLGFFQAQLAGAQQFASVLKALKQAGASMALLSLIAEQGPSAIPLAQALLQGGPAAVAEASGALGATQKLAEGTGKDLAQEFFGKEIGKLENKLDKLHEDLQILKKPQRLEIAFRPGADQALRHLIMQVIGEMNLSRASL